MSHKKVYIINGSPRKDWNTDKMCKSFARGVESAGGIAEIIYLYDINFKGCRSCFACKLKNGKNYARCSYPDELKKILEKVSNGDGICFATPIYYADVTGVMKSFIERLFFPYTKYDENYTPIPPKNLKTAVIYTMNVDKKVFEELFLGKNNSAPIGFFENWISHVYQKPERICAYNTYQFRDYSKYESERWDVKDKTNHMTEEFPKELKNAYIAGQNMVNSF